MVKYFIFVFIFVWVLAFFLNFTKNVYSWSFKYDCWLATMSESEFLESTKWEYKVLKEDQIRKKSYQHLKWFCCKKKFLSQESCWWTQAQDMPDSPYLMDHLVDIWFRILDWDEKLSYWVKLDEAWEKWRKKIREIVETQTWMDSKTILELFREEWKPWQKDWLHAKYLWVCEESLQIYQKNIQYESWVPYNKIYESCMQLAKNRLNAEMTYVKTISSHKSWKMVRDNQSDYNKEYWNEERLTEFARKMKEFVWKFTTVAEKINNWVRTVNY